MPFQGQARRGAHHGMGGIEFLEEIEGIGSDDVAVIVAQGYRSYAPPPAGFPTGLTTSILLVTTRSSW